MGDFWIDTKQTLNAVEDFRQVIAELRAEYNELSSLTVPSLGSATGDIVARMDSSKAELNDEITSLQTLADALEHIVYMYQSTDEKVAAHATSSKNKGKDLAQADNTDLNGIETTNGHDNTDSGLKEEEAKRIKALFKDLIKHFGVLDFRFLLNDHVKNVAQAESLPENDKTENQSPMGQLYGFTPDAEKLLEDAYRKFSESSDFEDMDNREKINFFFSKLAALNEKYSSSSKVFWACGDNPSTEEAIAYFNALGIDGEKLQEILMAQHESAYDLKVRDFIHECAIYSVMGNDGILKSLAGLFDNVDALVGYKGDVYTAQMGDDDILSDITAVNTYNCMENCEDGDIWQAMSDYNIGVVNDEINESLEFLKYYGDGDAEQGMIALENELYDESIGTDYLSGEYGSYANYGGFGYGGYGSPYKEYGDSIDDEIQKTAERFLDHLKMKADYQKTDHVLWLINA